jgi:hypothetical protein
LFSIQSLSSSSLPLRRHLINYQYLDTLPENKRVDEALWEKFKKAAFLELKMRDRQNR